MVEFYISERLRRKYYDVRQRVYESDIVRFIRTVFYYDVLNIVMLGVLLFDVSMTCRASLLFRPKCWLAFLFGSITILKLLFCVVWPIVRANTNFSTPISRKRRRKQIYGPYYSAAMAAKNERDFARTESYMSFENHDNDPVFTSTPTDAVLDHSTTFLKRADAATTLSESDIDPAAIIEQRIQLLKHWLSLTIFRQIVVQFDLLNEGFQFAGFLDVRLGCVPRQRLERFAEMPSFVKMHAPSLPLIIDYLSISENQFYLVERLRTLAFGYYIIDFKAHHDHPHHFDVPCDAAIVFHVFCVYMDKILQPHARKCGNDTPRPFFDHYVLMDNDKHTSTDILNNYNGCAIYCSNWKDPTFDFICQQPLQRTVQSAYNVFTVIIELLYFLKDHYDGYLNGVDLNAVIIRHIFD